MEKEIKTPDLLNGKLTKKLQEYGKIPIPYLEKLNSIFENRKDDLIGANVDMVAKVLIFGDQFKERITPKIFNEIFNNLVETSTILQPEDKFNFFRYLIFFDIIQNENYFEKFPEIWIDLWTPVNLIYQERIIELD